MKLLVTGGTGLLGTAVIAAAGDAGHEVLGARHDSPPPMEGARPTGWVMLDVTDPHSVKGAVVDVDAVVHTAYSKDGGAAPAVNVNGAALVARVAQMQGIPLVHVSSDVVFGGHPPRPEGYRETDPIDPVDGFDYGMQKASAERLVRAAHPDAVIIRTSLMYDLRGSSSLERSVISSAATGSDFTHFTDEYRCPVHVDEVAEALVALCEQRATAVAPVLHLGGPDRMSRAGIALALAPHLGLEPESLTTAEGHGRGGPRPADLTLDSTLAAEVVGFSPRALSPG